MPPEQGLGWYRIRFILPEPLKNGQPAVLFENPIDADETYLNGVKLGGDGGFGNSFVKADKAVRLYRPPPGILNSEGDNLLAVRVENRYTTAAAFNGTLVIGDYDDLVKRKLSEETVARNVEFVLFAIFFSWIEFCIFLYFKGVIFEEYLSFGIFMLVYSAGYFLDSLTFYETGLKTPAVQSIVLSLLCALPASLLYFKLSVSGRKAVVWERLNISASLSLSAAALIVRDYEGQKALIILWLLVCISSAATALVSAYQGYRKKLNESGPLFAGILWLCFSGSACLASRLFGVFSLPTLFGHSSSYLILLVWIIIMKYGLVARFARIKTDMESLSSRLLSAHEEERARLARELHDGMGQNLTAIKFNLQRVNGEMQSRHIDGIIEEVSVGINELRGITAGLMPISLKAMGLANTITSHAAQYSKKTGLSVSVEADDLPRQSPDVELNLFRIFQEALNNAVKHSGAGSVVISLRKGPPGIVITIQDNGHGFDFEKALTANQGLGLSIMRERSRIMGGHLSIESAKGQGTTIRVEAPIL